MRFLSVCSGIEAASVAWNPLGWKAAAFSEIEPFPCSVLAHHYPTVPNWGDMTKFKDWPDVSVDLLCGGTPCQSYSYAGLRGGLADPRGDLMLTFGAIAARYRPRWLVWENVTGVLSSNGGRDFGSFLGMLAQLGYGFAYRVLDALNFGVAQFRRRVFVVACAGGWRSAAAVLLERHSVSVDARQSGKHRQDAAGVVRRGNSAPVVAFKPGQSAAAGGVFLTEEYAPTLQAQNNGSTAVPAVLHNGILRRMTPRECERLQGFPDDYTAVQFRGKPAADGPRYKALGNSWAVPNVRWIGRRIDQVQALTDQREEIAA